MAVTANQLILKKEAGRSGGPVAASTYLYQGTLAFKNSSGYLDDDTATGVNKFAGIVVEAVDNSSGSNADKNAEVWTTGSYLLTGSGFSQATEGQRIYATDNYTITATNSASAVYVGICERYVSSTKVYVTIDSAAAGTESLTADDATFNTITFGGATGVNEIRVPTNLADALSIEITGVGDVLALDTSTGAVVLTVTPTTTISGALTASTSVTTPVLTMSGATGVPEIHLTTNLADALSCEVTGVGDIFTIDTTTGALVFNFGAAVRVNVAGDAQIGSATTDLVAFHGSTPTDQCAAYTQTFSTADRTHAARTATALTVSDGVGTNDGTIGAITADGSVIAAVQELAAAVNALIVDLADTASVVNAIVDDLQEKGLVG